MESICQIFSIIFQGSPGRDSGFINMHRDDEVLAISLQSLLRHKDLQNSRVGKNQQWFLDKKILLAACSSAVPLQD